MVLVSVPGIMAGDWPCSRVVIEGISNGLQSVLPQAVLSLRSVFHGAITARYPEFGPKIEGRQPLNKTDRAAMTAELS